MPGSQLASSATPPTPSVRRLVILAALLVACTALEEARIIERFIAPALQGPASPHVCEGAGLSHDFLVLLFGVAVGVLLGRPRK